MSDPNEQLFRFVTRLQRLEALPRTGWLVGGVPRPESVAAHCFEVAAIALWLADRMVAKGHHIDIERVLRIALLHDIAEVLLTDIPGPVKQLIGEDRVHAAEATAAAIALRDAPSVHWAGAYAAYEEQGCIESRLVKAADRLQMLARARSYSACGAGDVSRFLDAEVRDWGIEEADSALRWVLDPARAQDWWAADFD